MKKLRDLSKEQLMDVVRKYRDYLNYAKVSACTATVIIIAMWLTQSM